MMVTLTGTFTRLDGSPASGTVRVTPSRSPIMDPDGKIVISGPQTFPLDAAGKLAVEIPASNDPDLGPPFTYAVEVLLAHASWKISKVWIPHGSTTVDLSEIGDYQPVPGVATRVVTIPADGTDGQVLVWDGAGFAWDFPPEGPEGPAGEVTTAALTTALAGKVTGTGMTLRRDTTVGTRVFLDHPGGSIMLSGDTGWRDITSLLTGFAPTNPGTITISRTGNTTTLKLDIVLLAPGTGTLAIGTIPAGFRPASSRVATVGGTRTSRTSTMQNYVLVDNVLYWSSELDAATGVTSRTHPDQAVSGLITFRTDDAWPTALPGLPN